MLWLKLNVKAMHLRRAVPVSFRWCQEGQFAKLSSVCYFTLGHVRAELSNSVKA